MELKTFAEKDFDPKKWINKAWSTSGNQEKEVFVSNTVTRLQLYMKQLTNSLDETTTQIVSSIPRIIQDASALQMEGVLLQQKLMSLEQKVQSVEEQTGHSIESLQRIDQLKSRLESSASALREADKWAALATSLEDVLESGVPTQKEKLNELSEQVAAMSVSFDVLSDAPDYESKRLQLETLYNRLEAAVSPPLIEALTQMDADRTSTYVALFRGMDRAVSVNRCWRRAAASRLATAWRNLESHSLPALTRLLAGDANKQIDWLTNVLKSDTPLGELIRLYADLLLSVDPSPTKVASASMRLCPNSEEAIVLLTHLRRDIDEFIGCMKALIDAQGSNREVLLPATVRELGRAAHAPLRELLPKYTEIETQLLCGHLNDPQLEQEDLLEYSRALLSIAERCEGWLATAHTRAKKIAGDAAYPFYLPAIENFMAAVSGRISSHGRRIETAFLTSVTAGITTGVLSNTFPASIALESTAALLLDVIAERQKIDNDEESKEEHPLLDLPTLLLDAETRQRLSTLRAEPLASVAGLRRAKEQLRNLARAILRNPVDVQLDKICKLSVWNDNDALTTELPDFALSPQEYITEIGQYLMTLPQHLEMHLSEKQAPWQFLADALRRHVMKVKTLPPVRKTSQHRERAGEILDWVYHYCLFFNVCTHTCELYAEKILNIRNMDALGTKRCLTDIVYLASVVEDLGTGVTPALRNLEKSLRAATPQAE